MKSNNITIRLSQEAYEAYLFLANKHRSRSDIICKHGEQGLIDLANKLKKPKLVKKKDLVPW